MTTTVHDDLARARRKLDELARTVRLLKNRVGDTLDMRRVSGDVERLRDSLALLSEHVPRGVPPESGRELEVIPDLPYDPQLFTDADDEGVGGMRHLRH
jgi:hypothetical protein